MLLQRIDPAQNLSSHYLGLISQKLRSKNHILLTFHILHATPLDPGGCKGQLQLIHFSVFFKLREERLAPGRVQTPPDLNQTRGCVGMIEVDVVTLDETQNFRLFTRQRELLRDCVRDQARL